MVYQIEKRVKPYQPTRGPVVAEGFTTLGEALRARADEYDDPYGSFYGVYKTPTAPLDTP